MPLDKIQRYNGLRFYLFTGSSWRTAQIVCVDIYEWSVKVAPVDGW